MSLHAFWGQKNFNKYENIYRDYKFHPALKIGRKFDHALTRYDVRHFV